MIENLQSEAGRLIEAAAQEGRQRAFLSKAEAAPGKIEQKLAQLISALANTSGGTIYIGIECKRKKACGYYNWDSGYADASWLQLSVNDKLQPQVQGLELHNAETPQGTLAALRVPASHAAPHRCPDKNYYQKRQEGIVALEEPEIRQLYHIKSKPEIDIWSVLNTGGIPQLKNGMYETVNFYPRILVKNIGHAAEKACKIELSLPSQLNNHNYDVLQQYFSRFENGYSIYSRAFSSPIYPNEIAAVMEMHLFVNAANYQAFSTGKLVLTIYGSWGYTRKELVLKELLLYRHNCLEACEFAAESSDTEHIS
jgi:hypothetical protein